MSLQSPEIDQLLTQYWQSYSAACQAISCPELPEHFIPTLLKVWQCSDFVAEWCIKHPHALYSLIEKDLINKTYSLDDYKIELPQLMHDVSDENEFMQILREFRCREMVRLAWRDLNHIVDLPVLFLELSALAESVIDYCLEKLYRTQCESLGVPRNAIGKPQKMLVIALGKLGGNELNYSSDVDLMFAYPEMGFANNTSNDIFFTRLAQQLIKILHTTTSEGFVYRVDMRLRPFGDSGPLVMNFSAIANYYQEQGRDWERYALVKTRIITGDAENKLILAKLLQPFVYRRYVDYSVIDALRHLKSLFEREERLKDTRDDIKRGSGGIRQIEFIAQTFQLIRGGQDHKLQQVTLLSALYCLTECNLMGHEEVQSLSEAYIFLRRLEHRLQMLNDQQTHRLPQEDVIRRRIAFAMDYSDWLSLSEKLRQHQEHVAKLFANMMAQQATINSYQQHELGILRAIWQGKPFDPQQLPKTKIKIDWMHIQQMFAQFRESYRYRQLAKFSRERLHQLIPLILRSLLTIDNCEETLQRVIELLETLMRRSVYIALLLENPIAIDRLIKLFSVSPAIAELISHYPLLLDELLYSDAQALTGSLSELHNELRQSLLAIAEDDVEEQMETLRRFKQRQHLKIAMADILHQLPLMQVSEHLTYTAEVILQQTYSLARKILALKTEDVAELAIVAYGKLGGIELSYQSDLDLVFLYDEDFTEERAAFRLAQKIIYLLNTRTANGILYSVDTRLRPSGSAGLLVSNFKAFLEYQQQNAWTWEHQALVRARVVGGNKLSQMKFAEIRAEILEIERPLHLLQAQVIKMRDKMRQATLLNSDTFDVKQSAGGITDIEFIVQYGVLAWSWRCPQLLRWTDNIRLLQSFATAHLMTEEEVELLSRAYQDYRDIVHQYVLHGENHLVNTEFVKNYPHEVVRIWQKYIG